MSEAAAVDTLPLYHQVRERICSMDLLQWRGRNGFARAIRRVTGEHLNHSSTAILLPSYFASRRFSIEAEFGDGLHLYPLSKILSRYDGECYWYPLRPEYHDLAPAAACWLLERVGVTPYDDRGCLSNARRILGRDPEPAEESSLYCSESVFLAWRNGAKIKHLQAMIHAPVPGRPMEALGLWDTPTRIL